MALWHSLVAGLRRLFGGCAADADLDDEIQHYAKMAAEEYQRAGLSAEDAARAARVELGSIESVKDQVRGHGWESGVESALRDISYVGRILRRSPGFTATAVLVLALGIGVNTAIFSIVNAVFFRPLPVTSPSELGYIYATDPRTSRAVYRDFLSFRSHKDTFTSTAAVATDAARLRSGLEEQPLTGEAVSGSYFETLGVSPALGRTLTDSDDQITAPAAIVISDSFWKRHFAADPDVLGKTVQLDWPAAVSVTPGHHYTVVGVMGPRFAGVANVWTPTDYWVSLVRRGVERDGAEASEGFPPTPDLPGSLRLTTVIVRLASGTSFSLADALVSSQSSELQRLTDAKPALRPPFTLERSRRVPLPFDSGRKLSTSAIAIALLVIGATVVLIAAANLGGLLTARGAARQREIGVRLMIGASRSRIMRQLLTEGLILAALGSAAGVVLAKLLVSLFLRNLPAEFGGGTFTAARAVSLDVPLDGHVLGFVSAVGIGVGLLVSLAPVRQAFRTDLRTALSSGRSAVGGPRSARHWVVMTQVCLSLVLLLLAGVSVRTLLAATMPDPGYKPEHAVAVTFAFNPPSRQMATAEREDFFKRRDLFQQRLLETARATPEVTDAALTLGLPAFSSMTTWVLSQERFHRDDSPMQVSQGTVSPDYFKALGIPILRGRGFEDRDGPNSAKVAIVCERLARWLWPNSDPVGERIAIAAPGRKAPPQWLEVVGVVKEVRPPISDGQPSPWLYTALNQQTHPYGMNLVARTTGNQPEVIARLRRAVVATDSNAQIATGSTFTDKIEEIRYPYRTAAATLTLAGLMGLLLAGIGLYGVMSYSVVQRMDELGVRAALGATRHDIIKLVIKDGARIAALGSVAGIVLSAISIRTLSSAVVAIPAPDLAVVTFVPVMLAAAVLLACYIPARHAARADPMSVLRRL